MRRSGRTRSTCRGLCLGQRCRAKCCVVRPIDHPTWLPALDCRYVVQRSQCCAQPVLVGCSSRVCLCIPHSPPSVTQARASYVEHCCGVKGMVVHTWVSSCDYDVDNMRAACSNVTRTLASCESNFFLKVSLAVGSVVLFNVRRLIRVHTHTHTHTCTVCMHDTACKKGKRAHTHTHTHARACDATHR